MEGRMRLCDPCRRALKRARNKAWYKAHPEQLRAMERRKWLRRHPPQPDQACIDCQAPTGRGPLATRCLYCWRIRVKLRDKFGITPEDYRAMLAGQGGACAICLGGTNGKGKFHVDHNHTTGAIRGLLCANCNLALGQFKDDPVRLQAAVDYLTRNANGFQRSTLPTQE
jgi:hypothetical protein